MGYQLAFSCRTYDFQERITDIKGEVVVHYRLINLICRFITNYIFIFNFITNFKLSHY
jgi:hypothetical protein